MPQALTDQEARLARLHAQQLVARRPGSAAEVTRLVGAMVGVQAQERAAAGLALRARCQSLAASHVQDALAGERSVVRTWCLRGTLHLVAAEDLGWLLALLGPALIRAGRRRRAELGLEADTAERGVRALRDLLHDRGPLPRHEIARRLAARGIPTAGQANIHLIGLAALHGVVCFGPGRAGEETFVALDDWIELGRDLPREAALAELARRYLSGYGPADPDDLAAWSGLSVGDTRAAWHGVGDQLVEVEMRGRPAWLLRQDAARLDPGPSAPIVRLVPGYDPYLLGYRRRDLAVDAGQQKRIHPGGGLLRPALLVDGRAAGTWRIVRRGQKAGAVIDAFGDVSGVQPQIEAEIAQIAHFVEQ